MNNVKRNLTFALTILLAIVLQVILVFADCRNTPVKTAVAFSKAYYKLDPCMARWLCEEALTVDDVNAVDQFIYEAHQEAKARGFHIKLLKSMLYHIKARTLHLTETEAQVEITGKRRTAINPLYTLVAKIFSLGQTHHVHDVVDLVKKDDQWKVCGKALSLPGT